MGPYLGLRSRTDVPAESPLIGPVDMFVCLLPFSVNYSFDSEVKGISY